jgi:hypothetical protein
VREVELRAHALVEPQALLELGTRLFEALLIHEVAALGEERPGRRRIRLGRRRLDGEHAEQKNAYAEPRFTHAGREPCHRSLRIIE